MTLPAHIKTALNRFDAAAQNYAYKGSLRFEDRQSAISQYEKTRVQLEHAIEKAINK